MSPYFVFSKEKPPKWQTPRVVVTLDIVCHPHMEEGAFEGFEACDKVEALVKLITLWTGFALSFLPPDKNVTLTHILIITLSIKCTLVPAILQ